VEGWEKRAGVMRVNATHTCHPRRRLGMAIRRGFLVSSSGSGKEVKTMAMHKPKLPEETSADRQTARRPLVGRLDIKALHVPQGPDSGINAIIGKWPGDEGLGEDEERLIALIEEIS
jgi:hypothetical protein